jgi:hypothetical protein
MSTIRFQAFVRASTEKLVQFEELVKSSSFRFQMCFIDKAMKQYLTSDSFKEGVPRRTYRLK